MPSTACKIITLLIVVTCFTIHINPLAAQPLLNRQVTLHVSRQPLQQVLEQISAQGGFYFSYNSQLIPRDSLVSLSIDKKTVRQALDLLFKGSLRYKETQGLLILQPVATPAYWYVSGYVQDGLSGEGLDNVSVYEPEHLAGTVTDQNGYFRLPLKEKNNYPPVLSISVSRVSYEDTFFQVHAGYNQEVIMPILPSRNVLETVVISSQVEGSWMARLLISTRLKKQSANLRNFLASKPVQVSLTPGLGTHGQLASQVINKFSFNILGGYGAGVDGFELGGLYNIVKADVRYVQLGGLFNIAGGRVKGLQVAGLYNKVLDSVNGLQVGGLMNAVKGSMKGMQVSGLAGFTGGYADGLLVSGVAGRVGKDLRGQAVSGLVSVVSGHADGMVVSGLVSSVGGDLQGLQLSGLAGISRKTVTGAQVSGLFNYARRLKGWQIGLINYADTASGYSIGLININKNGFHRAALYATELLDMNLAYKAGNRRLYVVLTAGMNVSSGRKAYGLGYGLGNEWTLRKGISLASEMVTSVYYNGNWKEAPVTGSLRTSIGIRLFKKAMLQLGPSLSVGEKMPVPAKGYGGIVPDRKLFTIGNNYRGWIGWQAGISW